MMNVINNCTIKMKLINFLLHKCASNYRSFVLRQSVSKEQLSVSGKHVNLVYALSPLYRDCDPV